MAGTGIVERHNGPNHSILGTLAIPFVAFGRFMVLLAESNSKMRAMTRLNELSDSALAARGLTRDAEMRRIMGIDANL
ncbi:hypothetical protein [Paracoccus onubensis]|uniref:DUF1127 domain-containing protein n=1 Tax=Paracoccus onubensis TaxID=1675788 RepID=A0A418SQF7_9RHOB|nr:hypothetical protein [Paracoccus onubensis]RJE83204.1 hypothetical protein D3P04_17295 [Paracoccus onubensis]